MSNPAALRPEESELMRTTGWFSALARHLAVTVASVVVVGAALLTGNSRQSEAAPLAVSTNADPLVNTDVVINEVFYLGAPGADWIELKNRGSAAINVGTWWLCARFQYQQLGSLTLLDGADFTLDPEEILTVAWTLEDAASDVSLYAASNFGSQAAMVDFMQYGSSGPIGRANVAFVKGIWRELSPGVYDSVATAGPGLSASYRGINGGTGLLTYSSDFENLMPTRGLENSNVVPVRAVSWGRIKAMYK